MPKTADELALARRMLKIRCAASLLANMAQSNKTFAEIDIEAGLADGAARKLIYDLIDDTGDIPVNLEIIADVAQGIDIDMVLVKLNEAV